MSEKKVVRRSVAIATGIVCMVLIAGLGGAFAYYVSTHGHTNSEYDTLQNQVNSNYYTLNLLNSDTWVPNQAVSESADNYTSWHFDAFYPGYVTVEITASTSWSTYVQVIYYFHGTYFNQTQVVGYYGEATFPVEPQVDIEIRVGNSELPNGAGQNITITYYF